MLASVHVIGEQVLRPARGAALLWRYSRARLGLVVLVVLVAALAGCSGSSTPTDELARSAAELQASGSSQVVTWTCTSSPCPWGTPLSGHALVWPASVGSTTQRLGYTVSAGIYLPAASANGATVSVTSGTATAYAGSPTADSHRMLGTIGAGQSIQIAGLAAGEVVSVQGSNGFAYTLTTASTDGGSTGSDAGDAGDAGVSSEGGTVSDAASNDASDAGAVASTSQFVTWTCTTSPCPWGSSDSNHALVWPASVSASSTRLGYAVSAPIYVPAASANGMIVALKSGTASAYAGAPDASSHRLLGTLSTTQPFTVTGLAVGEVLSVQSGGSFTYALTLAPSGSADAGTTSDAGTATDAGTTSDAGGSLDAGSTSDGGAPSSSQRVTWTCTSSPCPWGSPVTGQALAWPASAAVSNTRFGYTVSTGIYLAASAANGVAITLKSGAAAAYAGTPSATSHRLLGSLSTNVPFVVTGLVTGEVLSVQGDFSFTYTTSVSGTTSDAGTTDTGTGASDAGSDAGVVVYSTPSIWRCTAPGCTSPDWTGAVITWPSWSAYTSNGRSGDQARSVYTPSGTPLYPYMGKWANGCKLTVRTGSVILIEWQRGTNVWRETWLNPGQSRTIQLISPEDGAMIEGYDGSPGFSVTLENCTPKPLP